MKSQRNNKSKFAFVTGGTRGIGASIARMLLSEGFDLLVTYASNIEVAYSFVEVNQNEFPQRKIELLQADQSSVTDMAHLLDCITRHEQVDCAVFNAGVTLRKSYKDITNDDWMRVMNANLNNNVFLLRDLLPFLSDDARIIFIGSMMAVRPHATSLAYGVTKSAVHALALNLVKVFEGTNITVNVIAPGFVETDWQREKPQNVRESICNKTAVKRFATPDEIADAVHFCLNNPFVNGSIIEVSGGYDFK